MFSTRKDSFWRLSQTSTDNYKFGPRCSDSVTVRVVLWLPTPLSMIDGWKLAVKKTVITCPRYIWLAHFYCIFEELRNKSDLFMSDLFMYISCHMYPYLCLQDPSLETCTFFLCFLGSENPTRLSHLGPKRYTRTKTTPLTMVGDMIEMPRMWHITPRM